jgi:hypothetical protein
MVATPVTAVIIATVAAMIISAVTAAIIAAAIVTPVVPIIRVSEPETDYWRTNHHSRWTIVRRVRVRICGRINRRWRGNRYPRQWRQRGQRQAQMKMNSGL